ncbi:hypothetical protein DV738_g3676, partial [Chaetothyriales sp. CBS 135597]
MSQSTSKVPHDPKSRAERHKAATERGAWIKKVQEDALATLPTHKLYIGLWLRNNIPNSNDFHWGFYYHRDDKGGTKYHIKNMGSGWITDHAHTGGALKSQFLCVYVQIGSIPADKEGQLDQLVRSYDGSINTIPGITCRVWIFLVVQRLVEAGLLRCHDLASLERECLAFGNECSSSALKNDQPRPIKVSSCSS